MHCTYVSVLLVYIYTYEDCDDNHTALIDWLVIVIDLRILNMKKERKETKINP